MPFPFCLFCGSFPLVFCSVLDIGIRHCLSFIGNDRDSKNRWFPLIINVCVFPRCYAKIWVLCQYSGYRACSKQRNLNITSNCLFRQLKGSNVAARGIFMGYRRIQKNANKTWYGKMPHIAVNVVLWVGMRLKVLSECITLLSGLLSEKYEKLRSGRSCCICGIVRPY